MRHARANQGRSDPVITLWDQGTHTDVAIAKDRIVTFRPSSSGGTTIIVDGEKSHIWVREPFDEVKKRLRG
jgi:hypothetical protein